MSIELPVLPDLRMTLAAPDVEAPFEVATLLADRARLGILALLRAGPVCVCEIAAALGERQNNVSNHLACLRDCGLVTAEQDGRFVYYQLSDKRVAKLLVLADELLADVAKGVYECTRYNVKESKNG